jgi:hypothetical protein
LLHGGVVRRLLFSLRALSALNISTITSTDIEMVDGRRSLKIAQLRLAPPTPSQYPDDSKPARFNISVTQNQCYSDAR